MSTSFYQKYWPMVAFSAISTVRSFFSTGYLLKQLNQTFLLYFPKCPIRLKLLNLDRLGYATSIIRLYLKRWLTS